ncbi:MAG: hypothetical protein IKB73_06855 [Ruminococcus sp.]|nr:hypothetical protein [Ruminococcus sp.]
MKTGVVLKSVSNTVTDDELKLINSYTRRELKSDEVYVFSVVLCDNDIDRDFERFTVESLFEMEKLFLGKTGIFDHNPTAHHQTARIFSCKVEAVDGRKTALNDDYFRLVAKAYIPKSEKNNDLILSLDSGILKEVSVGCAVKSTLCSVCSNDINSHSCHHVKGEVYDGVMCYGELNSVYDAYEFSFVAIPAQKNAGVIKGFKNKEEEKNTMNDILKSLGAGKELTLCEKDSKKLFEYIAQLETQAQDAKAYRDYLTLKVKKHMSVENMEISSDTIDSILKKLSVKELEQLKDGYEKKRSRSEKTIIQLRAEKKSDERSKNTQLNNQFTI